MDTYSILIRVRRTTVEYAYVRVPVTGELMQADAAGVPIQDPQGYTHIDAAKLTAAAVELAGSPSVKWHRESQVVEPHPIQKPAAPDEWP